MRLAISGSMSSSWPSYWGTLIPAQSSSIVIREREDQAPPATLTRRTSREVASRVLCEDRAAGRNGDAAGRLLVEEGLLHSIACVRRLAIGEEGEATIMRGVSCACVRL